MHKYLEVLTELEGLLGRAPFRQGEKLPSIRELARRHGCSMATAIRALAELERRHLVYSVPGSGYYAVGAARPEPSDPVGTVDFASSSPDPAMFPYLDFRHCINKAIDTYKNDLFIYGTPSGLETLMPAFRKQLAEYQVFADASRLVVVSGVQQALSLLAAFPFPNGRTRVLVEQPGYHLFIEYLELHGIPAAGIRRTADGIDMDELEAIFRTGEIKFFYTMPRFHNPLGSSYDRRQKLDILELARRYDVYVVEDDYLADFELDSKEDPMYAYDRDERVVYLKSYSKIIFPGLRVGLAVLPSSMAAAFNRHKKLSDIDSSLLSQAALEIYFRSGMFERHRGKLRDLYARRSRRLQDALREAAEESAGLFSYPGGGQRPAFHSHLVLNRPVSPSKLRERIRRDSVELDRIERHYLKDYPRQALLNLSVTRVKEEDIERGVERLASAIRYAAR